MNRGGLEPLQSQSIVHTLFSVRGPFQGTIVMSEQGVDVIPLLCVTVGKTRHRPRQMSVGVKTVPIPQLQVPFNAPLRRHEV